MAAWYLRNILILRHVKCNMHVFPRLPSQQLSRQIHESRSQEPYTTSKWKTRKKYIEETGLNKATEQAQKGRSNLSFSQFISEQRKVAKRCILVFHTPEISVRELTMKLATREENIEKVIPCNNGASVLSVTPAQIQQKFQHDLAVRDHLQYNIGIENPEKLGIQEIRFLSKLETELVIFVQSGVSRKIISLDVPSSGFSLKQMMAYFNVQYSCTLPVPVHGRERRNRQIVKIHIALSSTSHSKIPDQLINSISIKRVQDITKVPCTAHLVVFKNVKDAWNILKDVGHVRNAPLRLPIIEISQLHHREPHHENGLTESISSKWDMVEKKSDSDSHETVSEQKNQTPKDVIKGKKELENNNSGATISMPSSDREGTGIETHRIVQTDSKWPNQTDKNSLKNERLDVSKSIPSVMDGNETQEFDAYLGPQKTVPSLDLSVENRIDTRSLNREDFYRELQKICGFPAQVEALHQHWCLNDNDLIKRFFIRMILDRVFKRTFPQSRLHTFGSAVNGLGRTTGDVDFMLELYDTKSLPTNGIFHRGVHEPGNKRPFNFMNVHNTLENKTLIVLHTIIDQMFPDVKALPETPILNARVPVTSFLFKPFDLRFDITLNSTGVSMAKILYLFSTIQPVFPLLTSLWLEYAQVCNLSTRPQPNFHPTSFMLSMMMLHFLQTKQLLPPINKVNRFDVPPDRMHPENLFKKASMDDLPVIFCDFLDHYMKYIRPSNRGQYRFNTQTGEIEDYYKQDHYNRVYIQNPLEDFNICNNLRGEGISDLLAVIKGIKSSLNKNDMDIGTSLLQMLSSTKKRNTKTHKKSRYENYYPFKKRRQPLKYLSEHKRVDEKRNLTLEQEDSFMNPIKTNRQRTDYVVEENDLLKRPMDKKRDHSYVVEENGLVKRPMDKKRDHSYVVEENGLVKRPMDKKRYHSYVGEESGIVKRPMNKKRNHSLEWKGSIREERMTDYVSENKHLVKRPMDKERNSFKRKSSFVNPAKENSQKSDYVTENEKTEERTRNEEQNRTREWNGSFKSKYSNGKPSKTNRQQTDSVAENELSEKPRYEERKSTWKHQGANRNLQKIFNAGLEENTSENGELEPKVRKENSIMAVHAKKLNEE